MSTTYFKAVRPDGGSFNDRSFKWATEPGGITIHPAPERGALDASSYLSVSTVATDCTGFEWPARLLIVEPVGGVWTPNKKDLPNKRAGEAFRTVDEVVPSHDLLGPHGEHVAALIARAGRLTPTENENLHAAWDAAGNAARDAARYAARYAAWHAARYAARYAARNAAWHAAWDAAGALIIRDLIGSRNGWDMAAYNLLTRPWRTVIGPLHPDDPDLS